MLEESEIITKHTEDPFNETIVEFSPNLEKEMGIQTQETFLGDPDPDSRIFLLLSSTCGVMACATIPSF